MMTLELEEAKEFLKNTNICLKCKNYDNLMCRSCELTDALKLLWELILSLSKDNMFEKYRELKNRANLAGIKSSGILTQYLHMVQFLDKETNNYERHRVEMLKWLDNIERAVIAEIKEAEERE
mgnify:CR=1 FL=1